jgi:hypothetical protein
MAELFAALALSTNRFKPGSQPPIHTNRVCHAVPVMGVLLATGQIRSYLREAEVTIWVPIHCGKFFKVVVLLGARKKFCPTPKSKEASKK